MQNQFRPRLPRVLRNGRRADCDSSRWGHETAPTERHQGGRRPVERLQAAERRRETAGNEAAARRGMKMALTRDFRETVQARVKRDPAFRKGLLSDAMENPLSGDLAAGKELLRDYINATVGFPKLAARTSLH